MTQVVVSNWCGDHYGSQVVVGFLVETVCAGVGMWAYIGNSRVPLPLPGIPLDGSLLSHQLHMGEVNPRGRR